MDTTSLSRSQNRPSSRQFFMKFAKAIPIFPNYYTFESHPASTKNALQRVSAKTALQKCWPTQGEGVSLWLIQQVINRWQSLVSDTVRKKSVVTNHSEALIRYVLYQPFNKRLCFTGHLFVLTISVVEIIEDDFLSVIVFQSAH